MSAEILNVPKELKEQSHKIGIIASLFNEALMTDLLESTLEELKILSPKSVVDVYRSPGSLEIPIITKRLADKGWGYYVTEFDSKDSRYQYFV